MAYCRGVKPRGAVAEHAALMQHDHLVGIGGLVDQMRRPQHADALLGDEAAHVPEDVGARRDVETDRRLVEHQKARAVQECPCDLDATHLTAREIAHLVVGAVAERDAFEKLPCACLCLAAADAVQGGVIGEVLHDRQVEIQGARLEHDADKAQRFARSMDNVVLEHRDAASLRAVEPRDEGEQRAFAGAVKPQQHGEAGGLNGE
jgi:hypothetical protein